MDENLEYCCNCDDPTGRAGIEDDSLYTKKGNGPFCEECFPGYDEVKDMNHVMIDLETLGVKVDSVFISIGAVYFDPETGHLGKEFYVNIDWQSSIDAGRAIDASTLQWWFDQSKEAKISVLRDLSVSFPKALQMLHGFLSKNIDKNVVWGNGSSFDISILEHAYHKNFTPIPWKFWNIRDVRTIKDLGKDLVDKSIFDFIGVAHNALDDSKHQAKYVSAIWKEIKRRTK